MKYVSCAFVALAFASPALACNPYDGRATNAFNVTNANPTTIVTGKPDGLVVVLTTVCLPSRKDKTKFEVTLRAENNLFAGVISTGECKSVIGGSVTVGTANAKNVTGYYCTSDPATIRP